MKEKKPLAPIVSISLTPEKEINSKIKGISLPSSVTQTVFTK